MKKNFLILSILIVFVIGGAANTGQTRTKGKPHFKTNLTGNWFLVSAASTGKLSVLEINHRKEKKFKLRVLGSSSVIDYEWKGSIRGNDVSFSGTFYDGGGFRAKVRFTGQLISPTFIRGKITMENLAPNTVNPSVKALMIRTAQTFKERFWGFANRGGDKLIVGVVKDSSRNFVSGGFSGWPYGGGGESSCRFLQCGGQVYDYVKEGRKIILKTDAVSRGEGVAILCFSPGKPGTGYYTISGCSTKPLNGSFKVYGPYSKAEEIPFLSLKRVNIKKPKKYKSHKKNKRR